MKRILPIFLLLLIPAFLGAQQDDSFRLGIKGAPNFSFATGSVDSEIVEGPAFNMGFLMGGSAEFMPIPWFSVEYDLLYSYSSYGVMVQTDIKYSIRFSSVEMPLIVKGRLPVGNGSLFLGAGPDILLLIGKIEIRDAGNATLKVAPTQAFHTALVVSAGYDWLVDSGNNFSLEFRYHRGFSTPLDSANLRANRFDIMFGWSLNL